METPFVIRQMALPLGQEAVPADFQNTQPERNNQTMQKSINPSLSRGHSLLGLMVLGAVLALSDKALAQYVYSPWGPSLTVTLSEPSDPSQTELFSISLPDNARWVNPIEIRMGEGLTGISDRIVFVNDANNIGHIYFASDNESGRLPDLPSYPLARRLPSLV